MLNDTIEQTDHGLALRVTLGLRSSLHARPAARLAREAQRYASSLHVLADGRKVDAKSMLDLLSLAPAPGAELTLLARGADAREALLGLAAAFSSLQD